MKKHTRISLRMLFALVAYISVVLYFVIPGPNTDTFTKPMAWVYDYCREASQNHWSYWLHAVSGMALLLGTIPPFFLRRWWTIVVAVICGSLYVLIGQMEAIYA
jgi:hypothetical protein